MSELTDDGDLTLWRLARRSVDLDVRTLRHPCLSAAEKANFLVSKYRLLARHRRREFRLGEDRVRLFGAPWLYDSKYGLAYHQGVLVTHHALLSSARLSPARTVLDVGANVGAFTGLVRRMYPDAEVWACEPAPTTFSCLERNFSNDPRVHPLRIAVAERPGEAAMEFSAERSSHSRLSDAGTVDVTVTTVDDLRRAHGLDVVDLLKIDVESFEDAVLDGARETLARTRCLMIEATIEGNERYTISSLFGRLASDTYNFQLVAFHNFLDRSEGPLPVGDFVFENIAFQGNRPPAEERTYLDEEVAS